MVKSTALRVLAATLAALFLLTSCASPGSAALNVSASGDEPATTTTVCSGSFTLDSGRDYTPEEEAAAARLWDGDRIHIYNWRQLLLVGTGKPLATGDLSEETSGTGVRVKNGSGGYVSYSPGGNYLIEGDIALPSGTVWKLPEGFTGSFAAADGAGLGELKGRLYDGESDTIYLQNIYQLATTASDDRAETPVMSGDGDPSTFGTGSFIYPGGEKGGYLTYSANHNYVVSAAFDPSEPAQKSPALRGPLRGTITPATDHKDGRDFFGQVTATVNGEDYILIGSRQQLVALNTGDDKVEVNGPVYVVKETRPSLLSTNWTIADVDLYYPGDADLIDDLSVNGETRDYSDNVMYDDNHALDPSLTGKTYYSLHSETGVGKTERYTYCAADPSTGKYDMSQLTNPYLGTKYERTGKYIVFRDIDMNNERWTPMMFSGEMYGVKSNGGSALWDDSGFIYNGGQPEISSFNVVPADTGGKMDLTAHVGVGFFGTISSSYSSSNILGSPAIVQNIALCDGTVTNTYTEGDIDETAVSLLLRALGTGLSVILDPLLSGLLGGGKQANTGKALSSLLDARKTDPTSFATGAFAGRVDGDVHIINCSVRNVTVTTICTTFEEQQGLIVGKGGFVGSARGTFRYDSLSGVLGGATTVLSGLLNLVPGVGLGDLITVLLGNALPVDKLIPTGYNAPEFTGCTVNGVVFSNETGKIGVGGFAGSLCGTYLKDCRVINTDLNIDAARFAGGFAGVARDDIIRATLGDTGVTVGSMYPQSEIFNCSLEGCQIHLSGGACLGGFLGVQANSYAFNCTIDAACSLSIVGSGDCVGGFTGKAQLGTTYGLTEHLMMDEALLSLVVGAVEDVLTSDNAQDLLALGGVSQSAILGARIECPVSVTSYGNRVGGIVGSGDAVYISKTSDIRLLRKYSDTQPELTNRTVYVAALEKVHAAKRRADTSDYVACFAGGVAGYAASANAGSLLTNTLGLKDSLGFLISDVTVNAVSTGITVEADGDYAGGAVGFGVGGDITNVNINGLRSVTANNHAGGFCGTTGLDRVTGGSGINLTLLNISLLKVNNLIGLTSGIHTNITDCHTVGVTSGLDVIAKGQPSGDNDSTQFTAGGFFGDATSATVENCTVTNLHSVTASMNNGIAGGFVGKSAAGSLEGVSEETDPQGDVIDINKLGKIGEDLIPSYDNCEVTFVNGGFVTADTAGGFTGDFSSGTVNNGIDKPDSEKYIVHNIHYVHGGRFAGGFGGKVYSGALLRNGGSGIRLLGSVGEVDLTGLSNITEEYIPVIRYAGVESTDGFSVLAAHTEGANLPSSEGCAGGFIGYGCGMMISCSNVKSLRNGEVSHPAQLESTDGREYMQFDTDVEAIPYAVAGSRYAGGYVGWLQVGSANDIGNGIKLLDNDVKLSGLLRELDVVVSVIEHSSVYGKPGGYSVLASSHVCLGDGDFDENGIGYAGGYAGRMSGAHIQDSNADNFAYIVGEVAAGGYSGSMEPGNVADILGYEEDNDDLLRDLLKDAGIIEAEDMVAIVEAFVPTVFNSSTACIPCGGAVRAQSPSDGAGSEMSIQRGCAGGFVGHASGAQIWGMSNDPWEGEETYSGPQRDCDAIRIRSVYGEEYAGGYVGLLEAGSTARSGGFKLLGGLISADNLLGALEVIYPTIHRGSVFGPLEKVELARWNGWLNNVGRYGGFAHEMLAIGSVATQNELDSALAGLAYGYNVAAGRSEYDSSVMTRLGGCAGGYAGAMHSGVVRYGQASNAKEITAMRAAGGYVGEMISTGLAEFGSVGLFGGELSLNLSSILGVTDILVPVVFESGVTGYKNGLTVTAYGLPIAETVTVINGNQEVTPVFTDGGMAGGFVGACYGGQIGNRSDGKLDFEVQLPDEGAWVRRLKTVSGRNAIGGFAGMTSAASIVNADDSQTGNSFLQSSLNTLIGNPDQLVDVLGATVTVIGKAEVTAATENWGIVIDGEYTVGDVTKYANYAGGFVGRAEATVFGARNTPERTLTVSNLRGVSGGYYAGGFFGLASVADVAQVGSSESSTSVLDLVKAGNVSLLDIFRTYIYHATVTGVADGITIVAKDQSGSGTLTSYQTSGAAGGFGGCLINGTVQHSSVSAVNTVMSPNYAGGFIGIIGAGSGIGVDDAQIAPEGQQAGVLSSLGLGTTVDARLLNVVGSDLSDCSVTGFGDGFIASTSNIQTVSDNVIEENLKGSCAAGFAGYADMANISECTVTSFKFAKSPQTAGGFVGRTGMSYVAELNLNNDLTGPVVRIVNALVKGLYVDKAENLNLVNYDSGLLGLKVMADGDLAYVNLLGLKIGVALSKATDEGATDTAIVTIGSSTVRLPCDEENGVGDNPDISIALIEGTRTVIKSSSVTGISDGYDVFAGLADDSRDGTEALGYAGGFIGYNDAGIVSGSDMLLCDVVRGTENLVGPFVGHTNPRTGDREDLEANNNHFSIYRPAEGYSQAKTAGGDVISASPAGTVSINGTTCNRYETEHYDVIKTHGDLEGATENGSSGSRPLAAYASPSMAVLMLDVPLDDNGVGDTPVTVDMKDPCDTKIDLTVNKVWKDFAVLDTRPDSITVTVTQIDAGDTPPTEIIVTSMPENAAGIETFTLTLTPDDQGSWSSAWQNTLSRLPVALRTQSGSVDQVTYYQYVINEVQTENYTASYEVDQDSAAATIVNRYNGPLLPLTGGAGTLIFYGAGAVLVIGGCALLLIRSRRGKKAVAAAGETSHGDLNLSDFSDFLKYLKKK